MTHVINIPKEPRRDCCLFSNYFEKRTVKDLGFLKSTVAVLKYTQMSIQIILILIYANFHKIMVDGIFAFAISSHFLTFLLNCIPLVIGVIFKIRQRLIIRFEFCSFFILLIFIVWIHHLVSEADESQHLYYDYSNFYNSSSPNKLSDLFSRNLTFCEALIVLLPILLIIHFIIIAIFNCLQFENPTTNSGKVATSYPRTPTFRSNRSKAVRLDEFINSRKIEVPRKKKIYPVNFPKSSKCPNLDRISEAPSLESIEMKKAEQVGTAERESSQACGLSDNVKENMFSMEKVDPVGCFGNHCNLLEKSSNSEESSSNDVEIDTEKGVVGYKRSNSLKKLSPQKTFEKLESTTFQKTEKKESRSLYSESLVFDPQIHDIQEIVRPLEEKKKFTKTLKKNFCDINFSRTSGTYTLENLESSLSSKETYEHEHYSKKI